MRRCVVIQTMVPVCRKIQKLQDDQLDERDLYQESSNTRIIARWDRSGRVTLCAPNYEAGGGLPVLPSGLARIGATQVERFAAHVDDREIGRQIILAQDAGIGFRRRFRE